jgi:hypothetical protein
MTDSSGARISDRIFEFSTIVTIQVQNASDAKSLTQRYGGIRQYSPEVYHHLFQSNHSVESK